MAFPNPAAITAPPVENIGGYRWLKAAPVADIAAVTYGPDQAITALSMQSGTNWISVYSTFESIEFKESSGAGANAYPFTQTVEAFFPGNKSAAILEFEARIKQRMILAIADYDGTVTIIGTKDNGCFLEIDFNSRSRASGLKGVSLTWRCQSRMRARSIAEAVLF